MASIWERHDSRQRTVGNEQSVDLIWVIDGTDDDDEAATLLLATTPASYGALALREYDLQPQGTGLWYATARYKRSSYRLSIDTSGGTAHLSASIRTVDSKALPDQVAPDFKGAIGVDYDNVAGVDVTIPSFGWTETHYINAALVTNAYLKRLSQLTGRFNQSTFRTFSHGEVLFLGISGGQSGTDDFELSFKFAANPTAIGVLVGEIGTDEAKDAGNAFARGDSVYANPGSLPLVDANHAQPNAELVGRAVLPAVAADDTVRVSRVVKRGWDYLWVRYERDADLLAKTVIKKPVALYVEQVYEAADFSLLGIGT